METTEQTQPGAPSATTAQTGTEAAMAFSSSFSVVRSVGRFGNVWFNVVDDDGWTVECYPESDGGKADAEAHAATGRRPIKRASMSRDVAALFAR
tara:strand:- start:1626 stop:1910 length:285 start_codon:yes stop_codon:yes gene_type:complete